VPDVLVATDADWVFEAVDAALGDGDTTIHRLTTGTEVRDFVRDEAPDLVVLDLQIGNMGGIAACLDLRLEAGAGRMDEPVVMILLDRSADVFLARRSGADGWLIKPLDALRIRRAARTLLDGQTYREGDPDGDGFGTVTNEGADTDEREADADEPAEAEEPAEAAAS